LDYLLFALSATSFGQIPQLNFTSYQVDNFSALGMNRTGTLIGADSSNQTAIWSPTLGLRTVTHLAGDSYVQQVSDSGHVYGVSGNKLIDWNATGGRNVLISQAGTNFSIVSASSNDILLVKGSSSAGTKYYTYQSGGGLQQVQSNLSTFTPTMVSFDGSIYGTVPNGVSPVGDPAFSIAKLNSNGSTTADPRSIQTYSNSQGKQSQTFNFLPNGSLDIQGQFTTYGGGTNSSTTQDIYGANSSHYQLFSSAGYAGGQSIVSGDVGLSILANGTAFGYNVDTYSHPAIKTAYDAAHPNGITMDNSFFAAGSAIPDQFLCGNDQMLLGQSSINGHQYYSLANVGSAVPEPASMFAIGLGAVALIRRREKS
jgi:hypothetical protein